MHDDFAVYTCMKTLRYIYMHEDFARYTCMKTLRYIPMHEDAALYMTTTHTHVQALFMHAHMHTHIRIHEDFALYTCMKTLRYMRTVDDFALCTCMKTLRYVHMKNDLTSIPPQEDALMKSEDYSKTGTPENSERYYQKNYPSDPVNMREEKEK